MVLSLTSFQYDTFDVTSFGPNLRALYSKLSLDVKTFVVDTSLYKFNAFIVSKDSLERSVHNAWIYNGSYLYKLSASYPADRTDTLGYIKIARSFLASFGVHDTDTYWIEKFDKLKSTPDHGTLTTIPLSAVKTTTHSCIKYGRPSKNGFYRGPMLRANEGLFIAYDIIKHADTHFIRPQ